MRYRMERFVLLPFSVGCISESSVAIGHQQHKSSSLHQPNLIPTSLFLFDAVAFISFKSLSCYMR